MPVGHHGDCIRAEIHTSIPGNPPRTPLPISARPLFAAGGLRPSEFRAALCLPCQVPSVSPLGVPVEPDRPLASTVRTALELVYPSSVQTPSSSHHRHRSHPTDSSASRFP